MINYSIDFFKQLKSLVFVRLGVPKPVMFAYLRALLNPLKTVNDSLVALAVYSRREAVFNGQVMYLEKALNLRFDTLNNRIYIEDGVFNVSPPYLYRKVQEQPLYLNRKADNAPLYLYRKADYNNPIHFIVRIPSSLLPNTAQIAEVVNSLKQAGKIYQILTI